MTAAHAHPQLLSLADWRALPEDTTARTELQEGVRIVSPRPTKAHAQIVSRLLVQLAAQLRDGAEALTDVEVVITATTPATVRVPDVIVCPVSPDDAVCATDVLLAVEVISPGSRRADQVTKRSEYADAGLEHYWIVDPVDKTLTALELMSEGYDGRAYDGEYTTVRPFTATIDVPGLFRAS